MTDVAPKRPRIRDAGYLAWLRLQPCCVCGADKSDAAHIRSTTMEMDERYGKRPCGAGEKPDDKWAVPMCRSCHGTQHAMNEMAFWRLHGMDPFALARRYYARAAHDGVCTPGSAKRKSRSIKSAGAIPSHRFPKTSRRFGS